jgi:hypothetical protein
MGKKLLGLSLVGAMGLALWAWYSPLDSRTAFDGEQRMQAKDDQPAVPEQRFAALPAREAIGRQAGELFAASSWKPAPLPQSLAPAKPLAPAQPAVPPMPYRVAGEVVHDGISHLVLAKGDDVLTVRPGETLEDGYRIESIAADGVTLVYRPLGVRQQLPIAPPLAGAAPGDTAASGPTAPPASR